MIFFNLNKDLYFNEVIIASIALPCRQVAFRPEKDRKVFLLVNNLETFYTLDRRIWHEKEIRFRSDSFRIVVQIQVGSVRATAKVTEWVSLFLQFVLY